METTHSTSDAYSPREFYVPGTFQFSRNPGRVERFFRRIGRNRDVTAEPGADAGSAEFYLPGTPAFRARPR